MDSIRDDVGAGNVALLDAGDGDFAAPAISQLVMGESTIAVYNMMGYDVAAFGNHEFDKGQTELAARVAQSDFPWLGANVVLEGTSWDLPAWAQPYELLEVGGITLGVLGLAGEETPEVTLLGTTDGLVFKGLTETILHYYDEVMARADAMIVLAHMGTADSGPYQGLTTVAQELIDAGKPVDLMIGGHQHQALMAPVYVGDTAIVSAGYYGRWLGEDRRLDRPDDEEADRQFVPAPHGHRLVGQDRLAGGLARGVLRQRCDHQRRRLPQPDGEVRHHPGVEFQRGRTNAAANQLDAFVNLLEAQSGKKVDAAAAELLIAAAEWLAYTLPDPDVADLVDYWADVVAPIVNEPVGYTNIDLVAITATSRRWVTSSPTRCCGRPTRTTTAS